MSFAPVRTQLDSRTFHFAPTTDADVRVSWRALLGLWDEQPEFSLAFSAWLAEAPFDGFAWECPPLTVEGLDAPFECVVVDSPMLARQHANSGPFASQLRSRGGATFATFRSLGGDAVLIAPADLSGTDYGHLAGFLRTGPDGQKVDLWRAAARSVKTWLETDRPVWLSTAGLGVAWLHLRLDSRPKYYRHGPYRAIP